MASKVSSRQQAMAKARERRSALDQDRVARDRRVEEATAQVLLQLQERAAAEQGVQVANAKIGAALRRLLEDEGVAAEGVGCRVASRPDREGCAPAGPGGAERGGVSGRSLGRRRRYTGPAGGERSPGGSPAPRARAAQIRQPGSSGPVRTSDCSLTVQRDQPGQPLPMAGPGGQVRLASSSAAASWTRRVSALGSAGLPRAGCEGVGERGCSYDGRVAHVVKRAAAADSRGQRRVGGPGVPADDVADGGLGYAPAEQDVAANGWGPEVVEVCGRGELSTLDVHEARGTGRRATGAGRAGRGRQGRGWSVRFLATFVKGCRGRRRL